MLHGFVAEVTVPEGEVDGDGFLVILRFNIHSSAFHGNFQVFNADTFSVFYKDADGVELGISSTEREITDTTRPNTFTIVGERLPTTITRKYTGVGSLESLVIFVCFSRRLFLANKCEKLELS